MEFLNTKQYTVLTEVCKNPLVNIKINKEGNEITVNDGVFKIEVFLNNNGCNTSGNITVYSLQNKSKIEYFEWKFDKTFKFIRDYLVENTLWGQKQIKVEEFWNNIPGK